MMGLMLAVGMLVDNAVVITESIQVAQSNKAYDRHTATMVGVKEVGLAVMAGTFTTMIVFLPNVFGGGDNLSVFLMHVAIPICISLFVSLLVAQSLIPSLLARISTTDKQGASLTEPVWLAKFKTFYGASLDWSLRHPRSMALLILLVISSGAIPFNKVQFDMYPAEESKRLVFDYSLDGIYPVDQVKESVDKLEKFLWQYKEKYYIDTLYSYYNETYAVGVFTIYEDSPLSSSEIKELISNEIPS